MENATTERDSSRMAVLRLRHGAGRIARRCGIYPVLASDRGAAQPRFAIANPWPGDPERGHAILEGIFPYATERIRLQTDPWEAIGTGAGWQIAMNGFRWLCDLRATGSDTAWETARKLTADWLARVDDANENRHIGWQAAASGQRMRAWLTHWDYLTAGNPDDPEHRAFVGRLTKAITRLARHLSWIAGFEGEGEERLTCLAGYTIATLTLPAVAGQQARAEFLLAEEIERAILADGCHITRSPAALLAALRDLVLLREVYQNAQVEAPVAIQAAIDRAAPMVRFFRHGDGGLALFNDTAENALSEIDAVLAMADSRGRPPKRAPVGGFERLAVGKFLAVVDTGGVPPAPYDGHYHAGTGAMEFSWGAERIIVNCGASGRRDGEWFRAQRVTAAHSTLSLDDRNATEIRGDGHPGKRRTATTVERNESGDAVWLEMTQTGYRKSHGTTHMRRLYLAAGGEDLRGEDRLEGPEGITFTIRFHLHPKVQISLLGNRTAALLRTGSGAGWRFQVSGADMTLADSVYLGSSDNDGTHIRRTQQIVLTGVTQPNATSVKWAIQREIKKR